MILKHKKGLLFFIILSIFITIESLFAAYDLGEFFDMGNVWTATPTDFFSTVNIQGQTPAFDWTSRTERKLARSPAYANSPEIHLWNMPIWEVIASFPNQKLSQLNCSLYNKGDAEGKQQKIQGSIVIKDRRIFFKRLQTYASLISKWAGNKGSKMKARRISTGGVKVMRHVWTKKPNYIVQMKWGYSEANSKSNKHFIAEFITLIFKPYTKAKDPTIRHLSSVKDRYKGWAKDKNWKINIKKNFKGDLYVSGIPMVNQGQKGYCVVAALERMLGYYECKIDQHVLAQLGKSSGTGGTDIAIMIKTLEDADTKLGIHVKVKYQFTEDIRDIENFVKKYNRYANRMNKTEINNNMWIQRLGNTIRYDISRLFSLLDPDVYKTVKLKKYRSDYKRFKRDIVNEIAEGRPLLWGVYLGIFPEPGINLQPGGVGGHARLIIGYNKKSNELLYSDTWGSGHELKRMPFDNAWTISTFLTTIKPRKRQY
ncbi:MAG: hypothetical protein U9O87_07215 [Verrucomicrobiota bacterium]|nr:hypothetical protein [Verrucomicrobiota bacterium]